MSVQSAQSKPNCSTMQDNNNSFQDSRTYRWSAIDRIAAQQPFQGDSPLPEARRQEQQQEQPNTQQQRSGISTTSASYKHFNFLKSSTSKNEFKKFEDKRLKYLSKTDNSGSQESVFDGQSNASAGQKKEPKKSLPSRIIRHATKSTLQKFENIIRRSSTFTPHQVGEREEKNPRVPVAVSTRSEPVTIKFVSELA